MKTKKNTKKKLVKMPLGIFRNVQSKVEEKFDSVPLLLDWTPTQALFFGGVTPATIQWPMWPTNREYILAFLEYVKQVTNVIQEDPSWTTADRMYAALAPAIVMNEAEHYLNPVTNRPEDSLTCMLNIGWLPEYIKKNQKDTPWMTDQYVLSMLSTLLEYEPVFLRNAKRLWFDGASIGWLNPEEKAGALEGIMRSYGKKNRAAILRLWMQHNGVRKDFSALWTRYTKEMKVARRIYANIPASGMFRGGPQAYLNLFQKLHIKLEPEALYQWAVRQYQAAETELNRIASEAGFQDWKAHRRGFNLDDILPEGSDLVKFYQQQLEVVTARLKPQFNPRIPDDYGVHIRPTPESVISQTPTAACMGAPYESDGGQRVADFVVTLLDNNESDTYDELRREHLLEVLLLTAHEGLGHGYCSGIAPLVVPATLTSYPIASTVFQEGITVTLETLVAMLSEEEHVITAAILLWMQRLARIIAEYLFHCENGDPEKIVLMYADMSDKSVEGARRDCRRAFDKVLEFSAYALGASGVQSFAQLYMGNDIGATLQFLVEQTAGYLPPSLVARELGFISDTSEFPWLLATDQTKILQIARDFHPSKKA